MTIRSEIEAPLAAYATANRVPLAIENRNFTRPKSGCWLEVILMDSDAVLRELSAEGKRVIGAFQINAYAPLGNGMGEVEALVADVVTLYPVLPKLGVVSIEAPLHPSKGLPVDGFMCVPITGRYRAEF